MTAREYLEQYRDSLTITANLTEQAAQLRAACETLRGTHGGRAALDAACAAHIDYVRAVLPILETERQRRAEIAHTVDQLPQPYRTVIRLRYIQGFTWGRIAQVLHYSRQHVNRLHGQSFNIISEMLKSRLHVTPKRDKI